MCTKKLPDGQKNPTLADCYSCKKEEKTHTDTLGECPNDLYKERYGIAVGDVINVN